MSGLPDGWAPALAPHQAPARAPGAEAAHSTPRASRSPPPETGHGKPASARTIARDHPPAESQAPADREDAPHHPHRTHRRRPQSRPAPSAAAPDRPRSTRPPVAPGGTAALRSPARAPASGETTPAA